MRPSKAVLAMCMISFTFIVSTTACSNLHPEASTTPTALPPDMATCTMHYVWSPRMVLSAVHAQTPLQIGKKLGLRLQVSYPSNLSLTEVKDSLSTLRTHQPDSYQWLLSSKPIDSTTHGTLSHYPTVWLQNSTNKKRSNTVVGVMPQKYWHQHLQALGKKIGCF